MNYNGPRHRGTCSIDERKEAKRRFFRVGLRVSASAFYRSLKQALGAEKLALDQVEEEARLLFMADVTDIRFLKLQHQLLFKRG